ncbi:HGGxSTG domain-containing protein [Hydrogenophaga sp.]|uniref:HGGxSTG domain-containing protein n=1 Tax=Hydrogenophaga sp. TaxID=1904254 RepID=UPI0027240281|nr:HGGxSTG domain-containing protein [Hydrogenophaga sp.]MDO8904739.1 HGGxSTG domain-containing protein [Hydrogenophaga sp.]
MTDKEKRTRWRRYIEAHERIANEWALRGYAYPPPGFPVLPESLRGLCCGAKTRAGTPCKLTAIFINGRCKLHGGLSTGPTSKAGKAVSRENGKLGGRPKQNPSP